LEVIAASEAFQAVHLANHTKAMETADKKAKDTFAKEHEVVMGVNPLV